MDQAGPDRCRCSRCSARKLMVPGEKPARAEDWLLAAQDPDHQDGALQERYWSIFGFAILDRAAVEFLRDHAPMVKAGSGAGHRARELRDAGIDAAAADPSPEERRPSGETWAEVERLTAPEALAKYPERNMLIRRPGRTGSRPEEALPQFAGDRALHAGEPRGGCAGAPGMFREIQKSHLTSAARGIPRFAGNGGRLYVIRRNKR